MNPPNLKIPSIHSTKAVAVGLVSSLALFSAAAQGAITVLNTASGVTNNNHNSSKPDPSGNFGYNSTTKIYTLSYNAGATSDMLVLSMSVERAGGSIAISYGGSAMTEAVSAGSTCSIWYLANPAATGTITIDASTVTTMNGFGIGIASLFGNGQEIELNAIGSSTASTSVNITTTVADSFVMVGVDANNGLNTTTPSMNSPLTQIYANGDVGSSKAAAGYQNSVPIGLQSYTFTANSAEERGMAAAAFAVVPEPSAALLGGLGMLALLRRRRN